ncbi:MAG: ATP-dependent DNA helicase RecG [Paludibacteraceae bacterium]|nr:ATP-dependent DNA helicase RecG [Paludibacteraceae bacterium]
MLTLDTPIEFLAGVGPKRADTLTAELSIRTVEDLITHYPYKYIDRSKFYTVRECTEDLAYVQLKGRILQFEMKGEGRSRRLVGTFADGTGFMELVWFKGWKYVEEKLRVNTDYIIFGKPSKFGDKMNIAHPEVEVYNAQNVEKNSGLQGHYNTSEKMKNRFLNSAGIRKLMYTVFSDKDLHIPEILPDEIIENFKLMSRGDAMRQVHFPQNFELLRRAQARLKFEELFYIQLSIMRQSKLREMKYQGFIFDKVGEYFNRFYRECLPFELTDAQKRVIREIRGDMNTGKQMNRLLQGDVGSGKTMVALMTSLIALDNGYQACIMAPTEILATQHYQSISEQVKSLGITVKLLTGSTRKKEREEIDASLRDGTLQIVIGTHALIEDTVQFHNLGYVVIDEQHRFGVAQRAKLWTKNVRPPHVLVMTATPIPRTLAMTIYGDLEVSVIDQLPPGRKPIGTYHYFENKRDGLYGFLRREIQKGHQVYVVYPLIQESEKLDMKNLEQGYQQLAEAFPEYRRVMVHGKMKPAEKDAAMQLFASGEAHIMVATTVIEVGVNVPNASVMVIESAERFGLSQLHQLRGRVGRGADQSYCILMSKYELASDTRKRLQIMCDSTDGFVIAEADLNLRGPGDIDGLQQSGLPFDLKIANLATDGRLLQTARAVAKELLERDPELLLPEHAILLRQLSRLQRGNINWGAIS